MNFAMEPEKVVAPGRLAVLPVLDLHPGRSLRRVPGVRLLRYDPLHVLLANHAEQIRTIQARPVRQAGLSF